MNPADTGSRYDAVAEQWDRAVVSSPYGVAYVRRAIARCARHAHALDVGCGAGGRLMNELLAAGFVVTGIDISQGMLQRARERHADVELLHVDICAWTPPRRYDLIIAWDSTFHLPQDEQASVTTKLCHALEPGGVFLFTAGGIRGEVTGEMFGQRMYYSSLADHEYVRLIADADCRCLMMERDQYPLHHLVAMAIKPTPEDDTRARSALGAG